MPINSRNTHFIVGGAAAALALFLPRRNNLRAILATVAAVELGNALLHRTSSVAENDSMEDTTAPELICSASVDGIMMRWEEHGEADSNSIPVVMVHGIPSHPRLWRYVIPKVRQTGIRLLAWELVGFGWSMEEGFGRDISVARQADYLYAWLRHQGISKAVFVGHDLGGGVIQRLLVDHPELCLGLMLTDCIAYDNWPVLAVRIARSMNHVIEKLPPALLKPFFLAGIHNLGHDNSRRRAESIPLHWKPYARAIGPKAFANQVRHLSADDTLAVAGKLSRINAPARLVWGDADSVDISSGQRLATKLNAPLTRIPEGRHFTPEDHPRIIAAAINEVLAEVTASAPVPASATGA